MTLIEKIGHTLAAHQWKRGIRDGRVHCTCGASMDRGTTLHEHVSDALAAVFREHFTSDEAVEAGARAVHSMGEEPLEWEEVATWARNSYLEDARAALTAAMEAGQ